MKKFVGALVGAGFAILASRAEAHITMTFPNPSTAGGNGQKGPPPCGTTSPNGPVNKFKPGEKITVSWKETVDHDGRFRIAFAFEGEQIPDPKTLKDTAPLSVFIDPIADQPDGNGGRDYTQEVTLPNRPCTKCTLQLIQIMKVQPPYRVAADQDVYYTCATIALEGTPTSTPDGGQDARLGADGGSPDTASGGSMDASPGGSAGSSGSTAGTSGSSAGASGSSGGAGTAGRTGSGGRTGGADAGAAQPDASTTGGGNAQERGGGGGCSLGSNTPAGVLPLASLASLALARFARRRRKIR
jgi:hypothetical protein